MSAIDNTFHFVRNPTAINGLATTYVSKRGSDTTGDGTAQNPYASIAKITSVAGANTNIMLDDGEWNEARTLNNRAFNWWGNGKTLLANAFKIISLDNYNYITTYKVMFDSIAGLVTFNRCVIYDLVGWGMTFECRNSIIATIDTNKINEIIYLKSVFDNCVLINIILGYASLLTNCIFYDTVANLRIPTLLYNNCNFTQSVIPTQAVNSINDSLTGQTVFDYFNHYDPSNLENCDFTAKLGSANIGAGTKGTTIGLNQGYTMYADNSAGDMFSASNGATLKNIAWDSTLNGYTLVQKERICQGATANTITFDNEASSEDDYYNNLFIGIVGGDGYGELFLITDYDGATKTATIDGTWATTPNTNSIYTISGTILSATKDLGKVIKVKRNWTFADNFTALQDGQWAEFMTHVETNGKQFPASCYSYEYSTDGVNFVQGQTADDLVSATNGDNKVTGNIYGDCSANYDVATAKNLIMRYIRVRVHIGFNIGQIRE